MYAFAADLFLFFLLDSLTGLGSSYFKGGLTAILPLNAIKSCSICLSEGEHEKPHHAAQQAQDSPAVQACTISARKPHHVDIIYQSRSVHSIKKIERQVQV
ncbi:hypothetical protein K437DRAFT_10348 [Tilletiaria anomala UBC 951]|uniref:Secreted protein n=1 Tax=Tilletiaria anomala (strain ATCC 24038 / CBS 436.72 / UBC 951) TaxID=1037660 RepID=A0A066VCQ3_TILAU|nr:uncharacterized protein K437DRAFT_10348 [Tilletiaria anomala UBC 951]KDN39527.1 hypothetical protein K437DRAFT_10348 [Tilletiaria anomala UBC 951]